MIIMYNKYQQYNNSLIFHIYFYLSFNFLIFFQYFDSTIFKYFYIFVCNSNFIVILIIYIIFTIWISIYLLFINIYVIQYFPIYMYIYFSMFLKKYIYNNQKNIKKTKSNILLKYINFSNILFICMYIRYLIFD